MAVTRPSGRIATKETGLGNEYFYKDISISGKAHPLTGDIVRVTNFNAVGQSIRNILLTDASERPFDNLTLGGNIRSRLFDLMDIGIQNDLREEIVLTISKWEPRAIIRDVTVEAIPQAHTLEISITYSVRSFQDSTDTITLFLQRT
jgi:phage baseplate assembly protein W